MKKALAIAVLAVGATSCQHIDSLFEQSLPPETQAQLVGFENSLQTWSEAIGRMEDQFDDLRQQAESQARDMNWIGLQATMGQLQELQSNHKLATDQYVRTAEQERKLLDYHFKQKAGGLLTLVTPFIPAPLQPLVPLTSSIAVMLLSKRARKHGWTAAKSAAKGNLGEMVGSVLKAVGATHSSPNTQQVATFEGEGKQVIVTSVQPSDEPKT